jgi:hypothetical protein
MVENDGIQESFTIELIRFEKDGEKWATIALYEGNNVKFNEGEGNHISHLQSRHSYCDKEDVIVRAFYRAYTAGDREISNAGLPKTEGTIS